jgi:hypothetical protein
VLLLVVAYLLATNRPRLERAEKREAGMGVETVTDPREQAPSVFLQRAARLAEEGRLREALQAVYMATLIALDRRRVINFEPSRTNFQYLRQIPQGETRELFGGLTRVFDRKWYGREGVTASEYRDCSAMAEKLCMSGTPGSAERDREPA